MPNVDSAAFAFWTIPPWATFFLLLTAAVYVRGWRLIRRTRPEQFPAWRLLCMLGGLGTVWLAIASPLDALSGMLLVAHMTQHLLLMSVAPPLVALSAPAVPLLRGLPRFWVREGLGPFLTLAPVHALQRLLKSRVFAWLAMNLAFIGWHVPTAYQLAIAHPGLHEVEHACFFLTSLLFWWPVVEPWPVRYGGSRWMMLPYLMSADLVNTGLSAFLSFSGRLAYPVYAQAPRVFGISALNDQVAAGSLMWVLGSTAFLPPLMWITIRMLSRRGERRVAAGVLGSARAAVPVPLRRQGSGEGFDLFRLAWLGAFFKWRYGRQSLQAVLLLVSAAVLADGFLGHPMSAMNLAGIVPWTYARAVFLLALLFVGNLFCMSCPFMLPRELGKKMAMRLSLARLPWPRQLRGKWLSAALLGLFFWAYEAFAWWDSPARTAWLLAAYFVTAFAMDSVFRGASFCKYVCPVGQFNFVSSLVSPMELKARSQATCGSCSTRDCIAGNATQRGCELDLFMPLKSGNVNCTLCMDCVKACPHDNIGLFVQAPGRELVALTADDPQRSSVGRYSRRPDLALLSLIVVAAAFASAAVMVVPVASALDALSRLLPPPGWLGRAAGLGLAALAPSVLLGALAGALWLMRGPFAIAAPSSALPALLPVRGAGDTTLRAQLCRSSLALLPLGLGMWAAHLCFHLMTGWNSILPALQQAARDLHVPYGAGSPDWAVEHSLLGPDALLQCQLGLLDAGLLFALYLGWRMVRPAASPGVRSDLRAPLGKSVAAMTPWATVVLLLYAAGVWVLLEPMQMRGIMGM